MATVVCPSVTIRNLAIATDFSPSCERAVQHGLAIARHFGATVHFLHMVRPSQYIYAPEMIPTADEIVTRDFQQLFDRLAVSHRLDGLESRRWALEGEISEVAGSFVQSQNIDLLVLGTHGRAGIPRLLLGSIAQEIFHYVRCPVLVVGPCSPGAGSDPRLKKILFATDLSSESLAALPYVLTAMHTWQTELDVVHVCSSPHIGCSQALEELRSQMHACLETEERATSRYQVLIGDPAGSIVSFASRNHQDLIILGLRPRRALYSGPLWSRAYEIVRRAPCPVLSVRAAPAA